MSTMPAALQNNSGQIVFRLRAAFFVIVLLLLVATSIAATQLRFLDRSQAHAIGVSVPALVHSQRLESLLAHISLLQGRIRTANSAVAIDAISTQIDELKVEIDESILYSKRMYNSNSLIVITQQLEQVDRLYSLLLVTRVVFNSTDVELSRQGKLLLDLRSQFRDVVETRLINTQTSLNYALSSVDKRSSDPVGKSAGLLQQVQVRNKLSEISFRFLDVVDAADELSRDLSNSKNDDISEQANNNILITTELLETLEQDEFRSTLASLTSSLHTVILGQNGIVSNYSKKAEYQTHFDTLEEQLSELVKRVSSQIDYVVINARQEISESAKTFETSLYQTVATLAITGLLIAAILALVSYFVVERQINRRISQLTKSVLEIAKGDTDHVVQVGGHDEIGTMANSLQVFKSTAKKLRASNAEMEQFAYAASHDLRSPLRAIENLAQWTIEDGADCLPTDCHQNLIKILERAQRLSTLQTDLLEYAKAGHANNTIESVQIHQLVAELSEFLDPQSNYPIQFSGDRVVVQTYVTPLRQVVLNLITNAIKHHDSSTGNISVSVQYDGSRAHISVQDDGPGIEVEYQEQIFGLFNMLQSQDEVEGSGLGLALVRKLVSRYDGQISVLSDPTIKRGSKFRFDWPIQANSSL